jgi:hypothetical protein
MRAARASAFSNSRRALLSAVEERRGAIAELGARRQRSDDARSLAAPLGQETGLVGECDREEPVLVGNRLIDQLQRRRSHRLERRMHAGRAVDGDAELERVFGTADDPDDPLWPLPPQNFDVLHPRRRRAGRERHSHEPGTDVDDLPVGRWLLCQPAPPLGRFQAAAAGQAVERPRAAAKVPCCRPRSGLMDGGFAQVRASSLSPAGGSCRRSSEELRRRARSAGTAGAVVSPWLSARRRNSARPACSAGPHAIAEVAREVVAQHRGARPVSFEVSATICVELGEAGSRLAAKGGDERIDRDLFAHRPDGEDERQAGHLQPLAGEVENDVAFSRGTVSAGSPMIRAASAAASIVSMSACAGGSGA